MDDTDKAIQALNDAGIAHKVSYVKVPPKPALGRKKCDGKHKDKPRS